MHYVRSIYGEVLELVALVVVVVALVALVVLALVLLLDRLVVRVELVSGKQVQAEEIRLAKLPEQASTAYLGKEAASVTMVSVVMTEQKAWDSWRRPGMVAARSPRRQLSAEQARGRR